MASGPSSGITGMPNQQHTTHDRHNSYHSHSRHGSQAEASSVSGRNDAAHPYHHLHKSASQHVMHVKQHNIYEGNPSPASSVYGGSSPVHFVSQNQQYGGTTPMAAHAAIPTPPPVIGQPVYPAVPPRHAGASSSDPAARGRAHTTSTYHPSSTAQASGNSSQSPFYSLAAASGVVLPEHTVKQRLFSVR